MGSTKNLPPRTKGWEASGTRVEHQTWYSAPFRIYAYYRWTQNSAINKTLTQFKSRERIWF
jgi:hypothetical protein